MLFWGALTPKHLVLYVNHAVGWLTIFFALCQDLVLTHLDFNAAVTRIPHTGKSKLLAQPLTTLDAQGN
jgi:hypothetical protein